MAHVDETDRQWGSGRRPGGLEDESTVEHRDDATISIGNRSATLDTTRLAAGAVVTVPDGPFGHVYVVKGCVDFEAMER